MCMYHECARACRSHKRALDTPDMELQVTLSHHMGTENQTCVFCKSSQLDHRYSIIILLFHLGFHAALAGHEIFETDLELQIFCLYLPCARIT